MPRRDAVRNHSALVAAAQRLLPAPMDDLPLDRVATEASLSRATVYRHFGSRQELLAAVYERAVLSLEAAAAARVTENGVPRGLDELVEHLLSEELDHLVSLELIERGADEAGDDLRARARTALAPLVERARSAGEIRDDASVEDALLAIRMGRAVIDETEPPEVRQARLERVLRILRHGLWVEDQAPGADG